MLRQRGIRLLQTARPKDILLCREVESLCYAESSTITEYVDKLRHAAFNLQANQNIGLEDLGASDETLSRNTLVGRIQEEARIRQERFSAMLQEKYEALNDQAFTAIVRCRRCGSEEVSWEEKQTRSADEGATVFCSCATCKNRWVMRQ